MLKGSLEAAEAGKATAETQLQTAKSENRDVLVRTTGSLRDHAVSAPPHALYA